MKRFIFGLILSITTLNLYSIDFSNNKIGDSKTQILQQHGIPFKEIKKDKFEYLLWIDNKDIWLALFENEKLTAKPILLDDLLNSLLELNNSFSNWGIDDLSLSSSSGISRLIDDIKNEPIDKVDESLLKSLEITILECRIINKRFDPSAGYRIKVKNVGSQVIKKLKLTLYFYDKDGKVFFEKNCTLIDSDGYSYPKELKPNYSIMIPESSSSYYTVDGMDLEEWDEGRVSYEIIEIK
ncbi:MAG: hypothetical protein J6Y60_13945 [Treponema sp.]|nr:hypothetical protein [Treponema sp.]